MSSLVLVLRLDLLSRRELCERIPSYEILASDLNIFASSTSRLARSSIRSLNV